MSRHPSGQRTDEAIADHHGDRREYRTGGPKLAAQLLARQPGIQMSSSGGPGLPPTSIRGTNSKHTCFSWTRHAPGSATLGTAARQDIPLSQIERIEIVRGPCPAPCGAVPTLMAG